MSLSSSSSYPPPNPDVKVFRCKLSPSLISAKSRGKTDRFEELETCFKHLRTIAYYWDKIKQGMRLAEGALQPEDFVRNWELATYFVDPSIVETETYKLEELGFEPHNDPDPLVCANTLPLPSEEMSMSLDQIATIVEVEYFKLILHMQALYLSLEDLSKQFTYQVLVQLAKIAASERVTVVLRSYHQNLVYLETRDAFDGNCYRVDRMLEGDPGFVCSNIVVSLEERIHDETVDALWEIAVDDLPSLRKLHKQDRRWKFWEKTRLSILVGLPCIAIMFSFTTLYQNLSENSD